MVELFLEINQKARKVFMRSSPIITALCNSDLAFRHNIVGTHRQAALEKLETHGNARRIQDQDVGEKPEQTSKRF